MKAALFFTLLRYFVLNENHEKLKPDRSWWRYAIITLLCLTQSTISLIASTSLKNLKRKENIDKGKRVVDAILTDLALAKRSFDLISKSGDLCYDLLFYCWYTKHDNQNSANEREGQNNQSFNSEQQSNQPNNQ